MICLSCGHYSHPDAEMERVQGSGGCRCRCHPWNQLAAVERRPLYPSPCCGVESRIYSATTGGPVILTCGQCGQTWRA